MIVVNSVACPRTIKSGAGNDCNDANGAINPGATERCDGIDNNCDLLTDTGYSCIGGNTTHCYSGEGTPGIGACQWGTQTCDLYGNWGACLGVVSAVPETCNGIDDDCDGIPDSTPGEAPCTDPHATCVAGATSTSCQCLAGYERVPVNGTQLCLPKVYWYRDADLDGYGNPAVRTELRATRSRSTPTSSCG